MAVAYTIAYLAFSLPAVAAGVATVQVGLRPVAEVYGLLVVALGLAAVVARVLVLRARRRPTPECVGSRPGVGSAPTEHPAR
jgi:hypothetical protein